MSLQSAKRRAIQTNELVSSLWFLHEIATPSVRTGFAMTWEGSLYAVGSSGTAGDMSPTYRGLPVDGIRPAESRAAFLKRTTPYFIV